MPLDVTYQEVLAVLLQKAGGVVHVTHYDLGKHGLRGIKMEETEKGITITLQTEGARKV